MTTLKDFECSILCHPVKVKVIVETVSRSQRAVLHTSAERRSIIKELHKLIDQVWYKDLGTRLDFNITFHPQTDGQSERTIQTLEFMLRMCIKDCGG